MSAPERGAELVYLKAATLRWPRLALPLRFVEVFFAFAPAGQPCDVQIGRCLKEPIAGSVAYPASTRIIDLRHTPDELFAMCSKSNRYKIDRARRSDNVLIDFDLAPTPERVREFAQYYDAFALTKGVPPIQRSQLDAIARADRLVIATARDHAGGVLVARAYLVARERARLTHTASLFRLEGDSRERNRIGRANRLLHWEDIVRFRDLGMTGYDMGGWYPGDRNAALLRINSFKEEFGGSVVREWDVFRPCSLRGWLYVRGRDLALRARRH